KGIPLRHYLRYCVALSPPSFRLLLLGSRSAITDWGLRWPRPLGAGKCVRSASCSHGLYIRPYCSGEDLDVVVWSALKFACSIKICSTYLTENSGTKHNPRRPTDEGLKSQR
ncbi:hypothetical protein EJB05_27525, partial [Eragrostis curvula]